MDRFPLEQAILALAGAIGGRHGALSAAIAAAFAAALATLDPVATEAKSNQRKKRRKRQRRKERKQRNKAPQLQSAFLCQGTSDVLLSGRAESRIGHRFAAAVDGSLREARIGISKDAGSPGGDYVVHLLKTSGTPAEPDHTALRVRAVATVPDASVPEGPSTLVAEFAGPERAAGTEYGVVVARPDSTQLAVQTLALPATCLGTAVRTDDTEDAFLLINFDAIVEVLVG